ncbi:hypothetical protein ACFPFU_14485 [Negadavirga shengliensis]|uniref:Uncharacterized protein n=1 Tax=Negadavirga shengliensis TaxID=1389218 RepID=A0ABV9T318_9BACT
MSKEIAKKIGVILVELVFSEASTLNRMTGVNSVLKLRYQLAVNPWFWKAVAQRHTE